MKEPYVFYHARCSDGFGAAYCAWLHFGDKAQYFPIAHGEINSPTDLRDRFPELPGRTLYLLDFSFNDRATMEVLFKVCGHTVWLDHHKSSLEMWCGKDHPEAVKLGLFEEDSPLNRRAIRLASEQSGAGLAWDWFFPDDPRPALINYVEDFDLGRMALPNSRLFNLGLLARAMQGNTFQGWDKIAKELGTLGTPGELAAMEAHLNLGREAEVSQNRLVREMAQDARPIILPGAPKPGISIPCPPFLVDDAAPELLARGDAPYFAGWWPTKSGQISCSLRAVDGGDVEVIAKQLGGGGNSRAAAFRTDLIKMKLWLNM